MGCASCNEQECSGHGKCQAGTCLCSPSWGGKSCSIKGIKHSAKPKPAVIAKAKPAVVAKAKVQQKERVSSKPVIKQKDVTRESIEKKKGKADHKSIEKKKEKADAG